MRFLSPDRVPLCVSGWSSDSAVASEHTARVFAAPEGGACAESQSLFS